MNLAHLLINWGLFVGFCAGAMVLLRPVLLRIFTAQQRVALWFACVGWYYMVTSIRVAGQFHLLAPHLQLPAHLTELITNQTWKDSMYVYVNGRNVGPYYFDLSNVPYLDTIYVVSVCLICLWLLYRSVQTGKLKNLGTQIPEDDPWYRSMKDYYPHPFEIYVVEGLQTSFVDSWATVFLQKIGSPQRMYQILLHETEHLRLRHPYMKGIFTFLLVLYWWNPLLWLAFRYILRDMELACDSAVLSKLKPEERTEYAKTLVELGCGRQLWTRPLCFGECDAKLRVKAALKWKPQGRLLQIGRFALMAVVIWFFLG